MQSQKWQNVICLFPRQTIQYHSNPSNPILCSNQQGWRIWIWMVLWRSTRPSRTNTQKRCPLHYRELECKGRKSRNTWSNRQIWPWSTEWSRAKANRVLPRECTGHSKHPLPTTQEKTLHMGITRWSILKSDPTQPKIINKLNNFFVKEKVFGFHSPCSFLSLLPLFLSLPLSCSLNL